MEYEPLFKSLRSDAAFYSLRILEQSRTSIRVRAGVPAPAHLELDRGAMLTVIDQGGQAYAATADLSPTGLQAALDQATAQARALAKLSLFECTPPTGAAHRGSYHSPQARPLPDWPAIYTLLMAEDQAARCDARIVDSLASLTTTQAMQHYFSNRGDAIVQQFDTVTPSLQASASDGSDTQTRSLAGQYNGYCRQGGAEVIEASGLIGAGARIAAEALTLLEAPNCPSGVMDLLLMPDQMMLQIHESIGHPLELDRILGDERNFAGTSFVTADMFGRYRYGSELLNVSFDPQRHGQYASYAFDDDGNAASHQYLIKDGLLLRGLGGAVSYARFNQLHPLEAAGIAASRASGWNRAPIDRMANLNIEAGDQSLAQLIASIEHGVMMRTNVSWSIDDSRNKFQFGCEWGQMIEHGRLTQVLKNPNYRGISEGFWRSLKAVGDASTFEVMGTPFCGKGEPSQIIGVGHAAPACLFADVDVFGGQA